MRLRHDKIGLLTSELHHCAQLIDFPHNSIHFHQIINKEQAGEDGANRNEWVHGVASGEAVLKSINSEHGTLKNCIQEARCCHQVPQQPFPWALNPSYIKALLMSVLEFKGNGLQHWRKSDGQNGAIYCKTRKTAMDPMCNEHFSAQCPAPSWSPYCCSV